MGVLNMVTNKTLKFSMIGVILILAGVLIFDILLIHTSLITPKIEKRIEYDSMIEVTTGYNLGVDADGDHLGFGRGIPGSWHSKNFTVSHSYDDELLVKILFEGDFANWVSMSNDSFYLDKGESEIIVIKAKIPENATVGNYTGKLTTLFIRE